MAILNIAGLVIEVLHDEFYLGCEGRRSGALLVNFDHLKILFSTCTRVTAAVAKIYCDVLLSNTSNTVGLC